MYDYQTLQTAFQTVKQFGAQVEKLGNTLTNVHNTLEEHCSGDESGIGAVIAGAAKDVTGVAGKVFSEGGRVLAEMGERGKTNGQRAQNTDKTIADTFHGLNDGSDSRGGDGNRSGTGSSPGSEPSAPGGGEPSTRSGPGTEPGPRGQEQNPVSQRGVGKCGKVGEPIDVITGQYVSSHTDLSLPGVLPLVLRRAYASGYRHGRIFGPGWSSTLDMRVEIGSAGIRFLDDDCAVLEYPIPVAGTEALPATGARLPLRWHRNPDEITVHDARQGLTWHFAAYAAIRAGSREIRALSAISDRNGNRVTFVRDEDALPTEVRHSGGYRIAVDSTHTACGFRIEALRLADSTADQGSALLHFGYDPRGRLVGLTDSTGIPFVYEYDGADRITAWIDRVGYRFCYEYDTAGRVTRTTGDDGYLSGTLAYDSDARITTYTDSVGARTEYHYDADLNITRTVDPLGHEHRTEYDTNGNVTAYTDQLGRTTRYELDDNGDPRRIERPDGTVITIDYDAMRNPVRATDPDSGEWHYSYDERGNLVGSSDPAGATTLYEHDERGALTCLTNPLGQVTTLRPNSAGLAAASTDPSGATWTVEHDACGRVISITDPLGAVTALWYDGEGRMTARLHPDGSRESWAWDANGMLVAQTDQAGNTTAYEVGPFERITARTDPDGARYFFEHDSELRLTSVTAPGGRIWSYRYDAAGNLLGERDFNGRELSYRYDAAGQLTERVNGAGQPQTFARDAMGRIVERAADGARVRFEYDPAGRLMRAENSDAVVEYTRDRVGRTLTESVNGRVTSYTYDALGRTTGRGTPSGTASEWTFGPAGLPTALTGSGGALSFQYDIAGRETLRYLGPASALSLDYDAAGRLSRQTVWRYDQSTAGQQAHAVQARAFEYRPDGYPVRIDDQERGPRTYSLDPAGRVTAVETAHWRESYTYDAMGNLTRSSTPGDEDAPGQVYTDTRVGSGEREISGTLTRRVGRTSFDYDAQGRVIRSIRHTLSGERRTRCYTWNADDQLTAVDEGDGSGWSYTYDPLGRRLSKVRRTADGECAEQVWFTWDATRLIEQVTIDPDGRASATTWDHEPDGHRPIAQTRRRWALEADQAEIDVEFHAIVTDLVGTPTELVTPYGEIAWRAESTVWGRDTASPSRGGTTADDVDCPLRFPGQYHDAETGWNYNLFRYYDPRTAAYSSPDPLGLDPAPNHHAYVVNPLAWLDPLGLAGKNGGTLKYVTYTKTNPTDGTVYSGRSMGTGTPTQIVADRDGGHHMTQKGYGPAVLDQSLDATKPYADRHSDPNYQAIRGREQNLIDHHGGAKSEDGTSGNAIRGIGPDNPRRQTYLDASKKQFGGLGSSGCP